MLQTQVRNAAVNSATRDILVDTYYDSSGRVRRQSMPYDVSPTAGYNGAQHTSHDSGALGTTTQYDEWGRVYRVTAPDGAYTQTTYADGYSGAMGITRVAVQDPNGNITTSSLDMFGRTILVDAPTGPDVTYTYDTVGRLLTVVRGGATITLAYDLAGRKLTMDDPDMGDWSYTYDALGNLVRQTDAKNQRTCLYYDGLNRLLGKVYQTSSTCSSSPTYSVTYTYDAGTNGKGRRTGMTDPSGSATWTYDQRGRMVSESKTIDAVSYLTSYTYNSADLPETMTYPDGEILTYTYHNQMLLNRLSSNRKPDGSSGTYYLVQDTVYDASGRVEGRDLGALSTGADPALTSDYQYNAWTVDGGRMDYLTAGTFGDPDSLMALNYDYDADGNIVSILDEANSNQKQCFGYDGLHRLTSAAVGRDNLACSGSVGWGEYANETYTYDPTTGNLASKAGVSYTYTSGTHRATTSAPPA